MKHLWEANCPVTRTATESRRSLTVVMLLRGRYRYEYLTCTLPNDKDGHERVGKNILVHLWPSTARAEQPIEAGAWCSLYARFLN